MNTGTIVVLVAGNAWFGYIGIRAWMEARRFGPLMMAGMAAAMAALALGDVAIVLHDKSYAIYAGVVGLLCPMLVAVAVWRRLNRQRDGGQLPLLNRTPDAR